MAWQPLLTGLVLLLALGYVLRAVYRLLLGQGECNGCGGGRCAKADKR